jgi:type I restriction enzyme S subunit
VSPLAQVVKWSSLESWIPALLEGGSGLWPEVPLHEVLTPLVVPSYNPSPDEEIAFAGVRWYGQGVYHRETRKGSEVSGKAYPLQSGAIVYNRLFAWKQSFALVFPDDSSLYVSGEFPQFRVNPERLTEHFAAMVLSSPNFAARAAERSTGSTAVSRNRLLEAEFLKLSVPVPPLADQFRLVYEYERASKEAADLQATAEALRADAWRAFEDAIGFRPVEAVDVPRSFVARFLDLARWDADGVARATYAPLASQLKWPLEPLSRHAVVRLGMQKASRSSVGKSMPYLRAKNIRRGFVDQSDVREMVATDAQIRSLELQEGDLLFLEGSGSRAEIGRCAVWHNEVPGCLHQNSVVRARLDQAVISPEFACAWFNSAPGREYFSDNATTTSGLFHIGSGKASQAPIPVPPSLSLQEELAGAVWSTLAKATSQDEAARLLRVVAADKFAQAVFGGE